MDNPMEEKLKEIFAYVNSWLNFAEAKNGALIAINSAFIIGIINIIFSKDIYINCWLKIYIIIASGLLLIATGIALWSFLPMTDKFRDCGINDCDDLILIYYGDIARCKSARQYVLSIYKNYFNDNSKQENDITKHEIDYAKEIIYNSKITMRKYKCFRLALYLTISAIVSPILVFVVCFIVKIYTNINLN